jgi:hypothetical protein
MAALVRDVLGLPSVPVEGSGHDFFALPDGSTFADRAAERARFAAWSFRDDALSLRSALTVVTRMGRSGATVRTISCMSGGSLEDAIALAVQAHRGQTYAATDQPFILHPLRVMLRFDVPLLQTVAVLHDVVEDTGVSLESLSRAGFRTEVISAVDALTRRPGEPYHLYIERVALDQIASRVKCADLAENLANNQRDPAVPGNADRIRRYRAALLRLETNTGPIGRP